MPTLEFPIMTPAEPTGCPQQRQWLPGQVLVAGRGVGCLFPGMSAPWEQTMPATWPSR
jgi:hypothetical protein